MYQARGRCVSYHYIQCKSILSCSSLCLTSHRSPMGKPSHPVSYVRSHVSHIGLRYRPGQHWWYCQQRSDPSSDIDSGPNLKGYGASAPLLSTDSSLQSYHTANTSLSSPTSTCSSNPVSLPYTVTSVHSYKSNKKVLYPRCEREHPPPVALSSQVRLLRFCSSFPI